MPVIEITHIGVRYLTEAEARRAKQAQGAEAPQPTPRGGIRKFDPIRDAKEDLRTLRAAMESPELLRAVKQKLRQQIGETQERIRELQRDRQRRHQPVLIRAKAMSAQKEEEE